MKKIRTGVVGAGGLGRHHLKWCSRLENCELAGFYDIDPEKSARYSAEYSVRAYRSVAELAADVEAATVVTPTTTHAAIASELIERGVHVLIEKPVTSAVADGRRLIELAKARGVKAAVGHIERFNPAVQAVRDARLRPAFIEAHRLAAFDPRGTDVAVVLDLMIHDIDLALMLIACDVTEVQATSVAVVSDKPDIANARLTFVNGAVANLTASRISLHAMRKMRIFQQSGYYSLDLAQKQADLYRLTEPGEAPAGMAIPLGSSNRSLVYSKRGDTGEDMLASELSAFLTAVAEDRPVAVTLEEGLAALDVALRIERVGAESVARIMKTQST